MLCNEEKHEGYVGVHLVNFALQYNDHGAEYIY